MNTNIEMETTMDRKIKGIRERQTIGWMDRRRDGGWFEVLTAGPGHPSRWPPSGREPGSSGTG